MLPLEVGQSYFLETPTWHYIGTVAEVCPLYVRFSAGAQLHWLSDLPTTIATGRFPTGSEVVPFPGEFTLGALLLMSSTVVPWPFPIPTRRTHRAVE